ncbi:hypothetical protein BGX27_009842, partial [Mortierella sp. AM989]
MWIILDVVIEESGVESSREILDISSPRSVSTSSTGLTSNQPLPVTESLVSAGKEVQFQRNKQTLQYRGEPLEADVSSDFQVVQAPQLIPDYNDHTYDFYNHTQPDIEQTADNSLFHGPNDSRKHVQILKNLATNKGLPTTMFSLASMYYNGECIKQDYSKASEWFQKAASQGNVQLRTHRYAMKALSPCAFHPNSHDGVSIGKLIRKLLEGWHIEDFIVSLTTDDASNMKVAADSVGIPRVACAAHILHNTANEALKLHKALHDVVIMDVPTRWNSVLAMLRRLLELRDAMAAVYTGLGATDDIDHLHAMDELSLMNEEWDNVRLIIGVLTLFEESTLIFSSASH